MLKQFSSFLSSLDKEEKQLVIYNSRSLKFLKGTLIHRGDEECSGLLLIKKGHIRVYIISDEGKEVTLFRLHSGDACTLSASCILDQITFEVMIDAEEDTFVTLIPTILVNELIQNNISFERDIYRWTTEKFSEVMWAMQQILFMSFDKRLARLLLEEARKSGDRFVYLTHENIAKYLGSAREVVSRMLKYFEQENAVRLYRGKIEILDKHKIMEWS